MTNIEIGPLTDKACEAAKLAREHILKNLPNIDVFSDEANDIKINLDFETNNLIKDFLMKETPFDVLTEETGFHQSDKDGGDYKWIVDPIDGTFNLFRGIPHCCISIALWKGDEPIIGVIQEINSENTLSSNEKGTFLNGNPTSVSSLDNPKQAVIGTGFPVSSDFSKEALMEKLEGITKFKKVRMLGSAATSLSYVAMGKTDVYQENRIRIWDVAAGLALVKFAGGKYKMSQVDEDPTLLNVTATNGNLGIL